VPRFVLDPPAGTAPGALLEPYPRVTDQGCASGFHVTGR
jgi:hypothetical protein